MRLIFIYLSTFSTPVLMMASLFFTPLWFLSLPMGPLTLVAALVMLFHPRFQGHTKSKVALGVSMTFNLCWSLVSVWVVGVSWSDGKLLSICCPHIYSFDGKAYALDADPLSGALFEGAAREDWVRLEKLVAVDGSYRLKVINERDERDIINDLDVWAVDHDAESVVLPTQEGRLLELRGLQAPQTAQNRAGRDLLPLLVAADEQQYISDIHDFSEKATKPVDQIDISFAANQGHTLILRAHNTPFAADAFVAYLRQMGPAIGNLLQLSQDDSSYPYRQRLQDEMSRMGLPLQLSQEVQGNWTPVAEIHPIGPAVQRSFAVTLPEHAADNLKLRLNFSPLLWEIDQIALAEQAMDVQPQSLPAAQASEPHTLNYGDSYELRFQSTPVTEGKERSLFLHIQGYYELDVGGFGILNLAAIAGHQAGTLSLPQFALDLAQNQTL